MSFIDFESGSAKERARQELREARSALLVQAEKRFNHRAELDAQRKLRGEDDWMLPSVARKLEKSSGSSVPKKSKKAKKDKKSKKSKKEKKSKSKKRRKQSSSSDSDSSTESDGEDRRHRKRKHRKRHDSTDSGSSGSSGSDEWVETGDKKSAKPEPQKQLQRDDWMSTSIPIPTFAKTAQVKKPDASKSIDAYDPAKSSRELNPYWQNGGGGMPTASAFRKPRNDSDDDDDDDGGRRDRRDREHPSHHRAPIASTSRGNWRKSKPEDTQQRRRQSRSATPEAVSPKPATRRINNPSLQTPSRSPSRSPTPPAAVTEPVATTSSRQDFLTDQQMNDLGAKLMRAEIMGNTQLIESLKARLDAARQLRDTHKKEVVAAARARASASTAADGSGGARGGRGGEPEDVLLTATSSRGLSKPLQRSGQQQPPADPWGGKAGRKGGRAKKVDTHAAGERVRYFADDDRYDIKQMFENEKFSSGHAQEAQFAEIAGRHTNPNDDVEDIFAERVRCGRSEAAEAASERQRAIRDHQQQARCLDTCDKCFDSPKMSKQLIVAMGSNVYLALPWYEGLQLGHCQIIPVQHVASSTQLDEDVWSEVLDFQRAVTRMFRARGLDVIFFETARNLHRRPHMTIQCVPHKDFALAPMYFKKAILESEREWSTNKQLVALREKDLKRSIPKGLPYFWVHFGVDNGFAHVIEEQDRFPVNFAEEIIGGLLELDARVWRRQRKEQNSIARVTQLADWWKPFDCTGE